MSPEKTACHHLWLEKDICGNLDLCNSYVRWVGAICLANAIAVTEVTKYISFLN